MTARMDGSHPVDSSTRTCCGGIGGHTNECPTVARMDGGELQTIREYLGLTPEAMAELLGVNPRTVRSWEAGRDPIPVRLRGEVAELEDDATSAVELIVSSSEGSPPSAIAVFRRDADMGWTDELPGYPPSARWWRHVVARARQQVPGLIIVTAEQDGLT